MATNAYLEAVQREEQTVNNCFRLLGVQVRKISPEETILHTPYHPGLLQGAGVIAGGILATLMDEAMAHAAICTLAEDELTATIDLHTRYLRSGKPGESLTTKAKVTKRGRTIIHLEAETLNEEGQLIATATAAFMVLRRDG